MAKKAAVVKSEGKVKASAAIRQHMKENPDASAKDVAEAVSKLVGREISANYVYVIRGGSSWNLVGDSFGHKIQLAAVEEDAGAVVVENAESASGGLD